MRLEEETARLLRASPAARRDAPEGCLDDESLAALVSGEAGEQRGTFLAHLAVCSRCRHAAAAISRGLSDGRIAAQLPRDPRHAWRRRIGWSAGLAAAATIAALILWPHSVDESGTEYREGGITTVGAPVVVAPRGLVTTAPRMIWSAVPRVTRYRVRLYDATGAVLWESEVMDSSAILPGFVRLTAGTTYLWKVEAKTGRGRWVSSDLVEFQVGRPGP
jgi:hypothetical protein